jgi:hypothetical protein
MKTEPNEIDRSLVHEKYVFRTRLDRMRYIRMSPRDQVKWLKDYPNDWKLRRDVQQEASSDLGLAENVSPDPEIMRIIDPIPYNARASGWRALRQVKPPNLTERRK